MRLFEWLIMRSLRVEWQLPTTVLFALTLGGGVLVLASIYQLDEPGPLGTLSIVLVGSASGSAVTLPLARRAAYRRGWWSGRRELSKALEQARIEGRDLPERLRYEELMDLYRITGADLPPEEHHDL